MQRRPTTHLRTRRALLVLDCQKAFLAPTLVNGSNNPMLIPKEHVDKVVKTLTPLLSAFREGGDEVIWVNTVFDGSRESGRRDGVFLDEEEDEDTEKGEDAEDESSTTNGASILKKSGKKDTGPPPRGKGNMAKAKAARYNKMLSGFLKRLDLDDSDETSEKDDGEEGSSSKPKPKRLKPSVTDEYLSDEFTDKYPDFWNGEEYKFPPDDVKTLVNDSDKKFTKNEYSAFKIANFLGVLRSRMVTEIYFVGAHSNVSVFASVADAAMHGFVLTIVNDCVLYRSKSRHNTAIKEMENDLGVNTMESTDLLKKLGKLDNDGKEKKVNSPEANGEEVAGTGRIRNPTLDPQVVEALMEKLKVGSTTEEDEDDGVKKKRNSKPISTQGVGTGNRPIANGVSRLAQRESLKTPDQLIGLSKLSERPKSAPVNGFQLPPETHAGPSNGSPTKEPTGANHKQSPLVHRPYSMDAAKLEEEEKDDAEALVQDFRRNVRPRTSGGPPTAAPTTSPSAPRGPRERVRSKITIRRAPERKVRPDSPDKPEGSTSATKSGDISRAMSSLSISTISSGEAEKSQAAKDELLKSIMGKKTETQQSDTPKAEPSSSPKDSTSSKPDSTSSPTDAKPDSTSSPKESKSDSIVEPPKSTVVESKVESATAEAPEKSGEDTGTASERVKDQAETATDNVKVTPIKQTSSDSNSKASVEPSIPTSSPADKDTMSAPQPEAGPSSLAENVDAVANTNNTSRDTTSEQPKTQSKEDVKETSPASPSTPPVRSSSIHFSRKQRRKEASQPLGPTDTLGEPTDSTSLVTDFLPADLSSHAFQLLKSEVQWRVMYHRGGEVPRLVAVQGTIDDDGSFPIYRHPSDESPPLLPFSKTVEEIRTHVEKKLGHPVNHVLIQLYRAGTDYISEHSDKTLDIVKGSSIVNVSLGAQRVMTLRTKKKEVEGKEESEEEERKIQKIPLPNNSMFILGLPTNQLWMHSINQDKRPAKEKSPEELAFNGERISLTFRHIGTFLSKDEKKIWGQGAVSKQKETAGDVLVGDEEKAEKMVFAFARENRLAAGFDWEEWYGKGFDVLHFKQQRRKIRVLKGDAGCVGVRIAMEIVGWGDCIVEEVGVDQIKGMEIAGGLKGQVPVLEDVDRDRTVVVGEEAVLMFLATTVDEGRKWLLPDVGNRRAEYARVLSGLMEVRRLKSAMEVFAAVTGGVLVQHPLFEKVHDELEYWESWYQPRKESVSSDTGEPSRINIVDCAVFPYLRRCRELGFLDVKEKDGAGLKYDGLTKFVKRFEKEKVVKAALKSFEA
ncbi:hypothetical protein TWF694_003733 [Orbilia ellipsospora]|uniref:Fe2OG dioxygenase domain-containing protein n=1 Tax=Orbilia ellipsospora TaxID=2528407 RepID=A0AAV9X0E7_9PEZI